MSDELEMAFTIIKMSDVAFVWIIGPLVALSLTANIFFACSLIFPPRGRQKLKQPLKTLLGLLVWCMIIFLISLPLMYGVLQVSSDFYVYFAFEQIMKYTVYTSMTSCVWLSFYYHTQIVPARRAVSIWVKKNITSIIYTLLFLDGCVFLSEALAAVAEVAILNTYSNISEVNSTWMEDATHESYSVYKNYFYIFMVYANLCLCVMMLCSFSTAHYLHTHMRSLAMSGGGGPSVSSRRFRGQMRVAVTGILQGLLYLLYELWNDFDLLGFSHLSLLISPNVTYTVATVYMCGTTVNMAVSQAVFRQKAADVWAALRAFFCVDGTAGNDGKLRSSRSTLNSTAETVDGSASTSL